MSKSFFKATDDNIADDDELFQPIPPQEDCPLCFIPLPIDSTAKVYKGCCGKTVCGGCHWEFLRVTIYERKLSRPCCAFCRAPTAKSNEESFEYIKKRMKLNDGKAIMLASHDYSQGRYGLTKDLRKGFKLCLRAAELGDFDGCTTIANYYENGLFVSRDMAKARSYTEKAAKGGSIEARFNLGVEELKKRNIRLACRHWLISAAAGDTMSLENIAQSYTLLGIVTREEYTTALTSYRNVLKDEWSEGREKHADNYPTAAKLWKDVHK